EADDAGDPPSQGGRALFSRLVGGGWVGRCDVFGCSHGRSLGFEDFVFGDEGVDFVLGVGVVESRVRQSDAFQGLGPFVRGDELFERGDHFVAQLFVETIGADHVEAGAHGDLQTEFINGGGVRVFGFGLIGQDAENFNVAGVDLALDTGGRGDLRVDFAAHDGQNAFACTVGVGHAAQVPVVLFVQQLDGEIGLSAFTGD